MKRVILPVVALVATLMVGCLGQSGKSKADDSTVKLSEREEYRYNKALATVEECDSLLLLCRQGGNVETMVELLTKVRALTYDYNSEGMNTATVAHCEALHERIGKLQESAVALAEGKLQSSGKIKILSIPKTLLTEKTTSPFYAHAGEMLFWELSASDNVTLQLNSADLQRTLKKRTGKNLRDSLQIDHSGIYTIDIIPTTRCYSSLDMSVRSSNSDGIYSRPKVLSETVECKKGDWGAKSTTGIVLKKCFEEPRKFTLRGQLKATLSGNAKAVVAVQVPAGATDILYSLRIATSEQGRAEDGKFHDNLTRSYKRVKMLGLPVYEKSTSNGLLNTILDDNRPIREEDAYCNMYVFRNQAQAKQFQDGTKPASQLSYDVDYSTIGTQSCNGSIPTKGAKTIYLGFENERMRYTNYIWVEVEAVVPTTEYYTTKYTAL